MFEKLLISRDLGCCETFMFKSTRCLTSSEHGSGGILIASEGGYTVQSTGEDTGLDVLWVECTFKDFAHAPSVFTFLSVSLMPSSKTTLSVEEEKIQFQDHEHDKQPEEKSSGVWTTELW